MDDDRRMEIMREVSEILGIEQTHPLEEGEFTLAQYAEQENISRSAAQSRLQRAIEAGRVKVRRRGVRAGCGRCNAYSMVEGKEGN